MNVLHLIINILRLVHNALNIRSRIEQEKHSEEVKR